MELAPGHNHASAVDINGQGVLILGSSGSGKSYLALQLINKGAVLISDDHVLLKREEDKVEIHAPEALQGLIEIRSIGILNAPFKARSDLALTVDLDSVEEDRLPKQQFVTCEKVKTPFIRGKGIKNLDEAIWHLLAFGRHA